ncbi:MAG: Fic family protein [Turicibacter sp.]|nr:Fic family protein [Turicibacter sp.]
MDNQLRNKYALTKEQNVFLAKKTMSENIYYAGKFENLNTTFPQTETIVKGLSVAGVGTHDVQVILNMKNAWIYVLANSEKNFDLDVLCKINGFVAYNESLEWGILRNGQVGISGVAYIPELPVRETVVAAMNAIFEDTALSDTYKGIHLMLYAMRSQLFWDGNKRTAIIGANMWLMQRGLGLISMTDTYFEEFNVRLSKFYETNDYHVIDDFVYENCLYGIDFE